MAEKRLTISQQIALLPATIPDSILDFIDDFKSGRPLESETAQLSFDPEYLEKQGTELAKQIEALKMEFGSLVEINVEQGGRDVLGGYTIKAKFENGIRSIGILTKLKTRTITKVIIREYDEEAMKALLKSPPAN